MLSLIGLGLFDEKDITLHGVEEAKAADSIYIETYTSGWQGHLQNLEKMIGKKISILTRKDLEENSKKILDEAKTKNVAIFVGGDPLVATTHSSLLLGAKKVGIETKIIHNASIISAIAETGLHIYKFGATATIPFSEKTKGVLPESVYRTIELNRKSGLHTLCLLDVMGRGCLTPKGAIKILFDLENTFKKKIFGRDTDIIIFSCAGHKPKLIFCKAAEADSTDRPAVVIIPGDLHFTEKEYLDTFCLRNRHTL